MSQENVKVVRRTYDAFSRGDRAAWLAFRDQDCEMVPIGDWPDARAIRGREAVWDFYRDVAQTLGFAMAAYAEFVDAGADKVLAHQRHEAHGQRSGAEVEVDYWLVITFREGRIVRDEWFSTRDAALEAAGLRE
jgi:ketosteroid isomerase-like protein